MKVILLGCILINLAFGLDKLIIAHRGASGYLPEHTLESKVLAYRMNADYIEQDVALSKDDKLIVIHDIFLDNVSDVAQKFPNRARKDGHFYVIDFTLDELKSLNMSENFTLQNNKKVPTYPKRFPIGKSHFTINTLEEEIELIQGMNKVFNKDIGIYVETKKPWFHKQEGKDISKLTLEVLKKYGYTKKEHKVYFQSFDYPDLVYVKTQLLPKMNMDIKLVALITETKWEETFELKNNKWVNYDFSDLIQGRNYAEVAKIADAIGPSYSMLFDVNKSKKGNIVINDMVKKAHANGLKVHPYTLRADALPQYADSINELFEAVLYKAGADGVFTDFPDMGVQFKNKKKTTK